MQINLGDRRSDRRYDIRLPLRFKLLRGRRVLYEGTSFTSNLGRGGLAFNVGRFVPSGLAVEIAIDWPVLLRGRDSITLRVQGRVARSDGEEVAVRTTWYDFMREQSVPATASLPVETHSGMGAQPFLTM